MAISAQGGEHVTMPHYERYVVQATGDKLKEPDWGENMRICDLLNVNCHRAGEMLKIVRKRLDNKNVNVQLLTLELINAIMQNCSFVRKVFAEREWQKLFSNRAMSKKIPEPVRLRMLGLIQAWGRAFQNKRELGAFVETYDILRKQCPPFPPPEKSDFILDPEVKDGAVSTASNPPAPNSSAPYVSYHGVPAPIPVSNLSPLVGMKPQAYPYAIPPTQYQASHHHQPMGYFARPPYSSQQPQYPAQPQPQCQSLPQSQIQDPSPSPKQQPPSQQPPLKTKSEFLAETVRLENNLSLAKEILANVKIGERLSENEVLAEMIESMKTARRRLKEVITQNDDDSDENFMAKLLFLNDGLTDVIDHHTRLLEMEDTALIPQPLETGDSNLERRVEKKDAPPTLFEAPAPSLGIEAVCLEPIVHPLDKDEDEFDQLANERHNKPLSSGSSPASSVMELSSTSGLPALQPVMSLPSGSQQLSSGVDTSNLSSASFLPVIDYGNPFIPSYPSASFPGSGPP